MTTTRSTDRARTLAALRLVGAEFAASVLHYHEGTIAPVAYVPDSCGTCSRAKALAARALADLETSAAADAEPGIPQEPLPILCELPIDVTQQQWCKRRIGHDGTCSPTPDTVQEDQP